MKYYFAPMDGLTGYIYRNAHKELFNSNNGISKYFSPFIFANQSGSFKSRDMHDILPENNQGLHLVPQLLTNNARDFIHTVRNIKQLGYDEVNLNLGCPSGTVVAKNRGSGFLANPERLDEFLEEIFAQAITKISIKTRIGKDRPEEFCELIRIFNKYPMEELIIHPRIQKDFYKNKPNLKVFAEALAISKNPVSYNGDIFTAQDYQAFVAAFPEVGSLMLGRGLIADPALVNCLTHNTKLDKDLLRQFHDRVYNDYKGILSGERNVLFKMKEIWSFMSAAFSDPAKYAKKIMKSERWPDYDAAVASLFREQEIVESREF